MTKKDLLLSQLMRVYIDGISIDLTASLLPISTHFSLASNVHIHTHVKQQHKYAQKSEVKNICDMGGNTGEFSKITAEVENSYVVCSDIDQGATDKHFLALKEKKIRNILPIIVDLTNPSPSIGFANQERLSIGARSQFDCVMALALIHHISIFNNVPFIKTAKYFAELGQYLIIEFVPKGDSQVEKIYLTNMTRKTLNYNFLNTTL